ncbi:MAG: hypothetical protein IPL42_09595 [Saprospiraceae bacterium]|nr:hypothetical protein [Saprospiraceae bacterium]
MALPTGGIYNGPGVSSIFNPAIAGVGTHTITYSYTNPATGCSNNCTFTVTVKPTFSINPLQDTTRICGTNTTLDAGAGYTSYSWNNGATTQTISPTISGTYKVSVTNATGCSSDSTILSIVNANILQNDTMICAGNSLTLSLDGNNGSQQICSSF